MSFGCIIRKTRANGFAHDDKVEVGGRKQATAKAMTRATVPRMQVESMI
jgi:hypothetical protein